MPSFHLRLLELLLFPAPAPAEPVTLLPPGGGGGVGIPDFRVPRCLPPPVDRILYALLLDDGLDGLENSPADLGGVGLGLLVCCCGLRCGGLRSPDDVLVFGVALESNRISPPPPDRLGDVVGFFALEVGVVRT